MCRVNITCHFFAWNKTFIQNLIMSVIAILAGSAIVVVNDCIRLRDIACHFFEKMSMFVLVTFDSGGSQGRMDMVECI